MFENIDVKVSSEVRYKSGVQLPRIGIRCSALYSRLRNARDVCAPAESEGGKANDTLTATLLYGAMHRVTVTPHDTHTIHLYTTIT